MWPILRSLFECQPCGMAAQKKPKMEHKWWINAVGPALTHNKYARKPLVKSPTDVNIRGSPLRGTRYVGAMCVHFWFQPCCLPVNDARGSTAIQGCVPSMVCNCDDFECSDRTFCLMESTHFGEHHESASPSVYQLYHC